MNYRVLLLFLIILSVSCQKNKETNWRDYSEQKLESLIGSQVYIPWETGNAYPDSSTIISLNKSGLKIVFNVDLDCSVCGIKFKYWEDFCDSILNINGIEIPIIAIVKTDYPRDVAPEVYSKWHRTWIYDPEGSFVEKNEIDDDRFQAMIVGRNDTVVIVGNPVHNPAMRGVYEKAIASRL